MSSTPAKISISAPLSKDIQLAKMETIGDKHTYGQILRSSAIIGGSQVISIGIRIVRAKAMALLLGPAGVGLLGVYESIANLFQCIAGLGINSSGVRQIAESIGTGEKERIGRTVTVLRRTSVFLGILGAVLLVVFSKQMSTLTFGNDQNAASVALLSLAVFFSLVSGAQGALIQGMRRISDLARMGVLGTLFGTMISIPVVYLMGEKGVVPAIVGIAAMTIMTSWWYSHKVRIKPPEMNISQVKQEAGSLLKLGFAFMASGFLMMGSAYAVRTMVLRIVGIEAAGLYQSAWALGGLYVGFILQAMGADFFPRLTAVGRDNPGCNRLVNEQAQISLLLAGPGVLATLTFAPVVVSLFYSGKFDAAVGLLRWFCLGMTLRVITWPMGFIILAKGESKFFFWTELAWTIVNVGLSWICIKTFGLNGAGIAFFGSYAFHGLLIYPIVRYLSGFRWSVGNRKTGLLFLSLIAVVFCSFHFLPNLLAMGVGTLAMILSVAYSIRTLFNLISLESLPYPMQRLLMRFWFRKNE